MKWRRDVNGDYRHGSWRIEGMNAGPGNGLRWRLWLYRTKYAHEVHQADFDLLCNAKAHVHALIAQARDMLADTNEPTALRHAFDDLKRALKRLNDDPRWKLDT